MPIDAPRRTKSLSARSRWLILLAAASALAAADQSVDLDARRQRLYSMSAERLALVERNRERLAQLPADEQTRLRRLAGQVEQASDRERLEAVMTRYQEWLRKLGLPQRSELIELPVDERIAKIKQIRNAQRESLRAESTAGEILGPADLEVMLKFVGMHAKRNEQRLLAEASPERREQIEKITDADRKSRALIWELAKHSHAGKGAGVLVFSQSEIDQLIPRLSPPASEQLQNAGGQTQQRQLVRRWVQVAVRQRIEEAGLTRQVPPVAAEDLRQFFESLPQSQRTELMELPPDKMQRELRRLFFLQAGQPEGLPPGAGGAAPPGPRVEPPRDKSDKNDHKPATTPDEKAAKARRAAERAKNSKAAKDGSTDPAPDPSGN